VAMLCCVWLVASVWVRRPSDWEEPQGSLPRLVWARVGLVLGQRVAAGENRHERDAEMERFEQEPEKHLVELASVRSSLDGLSADLFDRQERLNADAERLQQELGLQIEAMRALVGRVGRFEQRVSEVSGSCASERPTPESDRWPAEEAGVPDLAPDRHRSADPETVRDDATADLDFDAAWQELETDLRLEKIAEREQLLGEREESVNRRERELAAFVAQTQAQLG
jgi:hypothetical protein